jgi:hypothetical protein
MNDFDVATGVNYGVYGAASCSSWSNSMFYPQMDITRLRGPTKITASFQRKGGQAGLYLSPAWASP